MKLLLSCLKRRREKNENSLLPSVPMSRARVSLDDFSQMRWETTDRNLVNHKKPAKMT